MGSNLVIVAIPARDEQVWKVSSEQVPHLTLLFLGENTEDVAKLEQIVEFVDHAVTVEEHGPVMLSVDERGTLGPDEADVLFFEKDYSIKWLTHFRNQLLQQNDIRAAYESVPQYPEWQPHLTLGYPATPANEDEIPEHGLNWISFDRIAVWTEDFDGPEFKLRWPDRSQEEPCMAMASTNDARKALGLDALVKELEISVEHHGVKGMRWGVRKPKDTSVTVNGRTKMVTAKKAAKLDSKWAKNQFTLPKGIERHNAMAEHFNARIGSLNDKYKHDDFSKENFDSPAHWTPKFKQYNKDVMALNEASFRQAVTQVHTPSPTGKKKVVVEGDINNDTMHIVIKDAANVVTHTTVGSNDEVFLFKITRDANGLITDIQPVEDSMAQTADIGAEFIEHHGIKGMKWGVRKETAVGGAKKVGRGIVKGAKLASDIQFENMAHDGRAADHIEMRGHIDFRKHDLPKINAKPEYQAARKLKTRLRNPRDPVVKQYRKEVKTTYLQRMEKTANSITNASGTRQYTIRERGWDLPPEGGNIPTSRHFWAVSTRTVQHADATIKPFFVELTLDQDGFVTDINPVDPTSIAKHTADLGAEFIEHYGIKGMHWGIRSRQGTRSTPMPVAPKATSKVPSGNARKTKVEVSGGHNHPAHPDAIKVAEAKAKLKKSGAHALSNQELRDVANRVQLENQVKLLTGRKGKQFVTRQLQNEGQNLARAGVREGVKRGVKKAGIAALA